VNESNPEEQDNGQGEAGNGAGPVPTAEDRVAALTAERDEMKDRMLRIAAEFENWKKRARKEQEDGEAKVAAVERAWEGLPPTWDAASEQAIFDLLCDLYRHKRHHASELPAVKPTVTKSATPPQSTSSGGRPRVDTGDPWK